MFARKRVRVGLRVPFDCSGGTHAVTKPERNNAKTKKIKFLID
jgi:hypothetical protein